MWEVRISINGYKCRSCGKFTGLNEVMLVEHRRIPCTSILQDVRTMCISCHAKHTEAVEAELKRLKEGGGRG